MLQPTTQPHRWRHLNIIGFKDLISWSVSYLNQRQISYSQKYPFVRIGDFLTRNKTVVRIQDSEAYKRVTVRLYGGGVKIRDEAKGVEIGTKNQFLIKKGQFLFSRIDARNGAFGIATNEIDYAVVTNDFPVYDIDNSVINPTFFSLLTTTNHFFSFCQTISSGTTGRQRMDEDTFLNFSIPLPPLDEQEQLAFNYNSRVECAQANEVKAKKLEQECETYLLNQLGIKIHKAQTKKGLQFVDFKDISRWAVDYLQHLTSLNDIKKCKYEIIRLGELITSSQYGTSDKAGYEQDGFPMLRMNNISRGELDISNLKFAKPDQNKLRNLLLQKGDLLFNRTNSKELVGKAAVFDLEGNYVFASYLIRLRLDTNQVDVHFVNYLFDSPIIRQQIDMISRQITGLANVNLTELSEFLVPLPPLPIQKRIIERISALKTEIKQLKAEAERLRETAKAEFETEVFEV